LTAQSLRMRFQILVSGMTKRCYIEERGELAEL